MRTSKASKLPHWVADLLGRGDTPETPAAPQFATHTVLTDYHHGGARGNAAILSGLNSATWPAKSGNDGSDDAVREDQPASQTEMAALSAPPAPTSSASDSETSNAPAESNTETTAPMLAALTTTGTPWISNPVIVNAFDTTAFGSPDPSGLAFIPGATPGTGKLLLSDSEVDESPFLQANNLFTLSQTGTFDQATSLRSFTDEPTGLAYNPNNGHLYISDDDKDGIFEVDPNNPGVALNFFSTRAYATDAEDVAYDPVSDHLLIMEGGTGELNAATVFETTTSGTLVQSIVLPSTIVDPEAIAYDPVHQVFYVTGGSARDIWVVSRDGQTILNTITVMETMTNTLSGTTVHPKGLLIAPSSDPNDDPGTMSLYVADYGGQHITDGRIYEIQLSSNPTEPALFSTTDDNVDFNTLTKGSYLAGSQYEALAGNDTVILPATAAAAAAAGYNPVQTAFHGNEGNDTITGGALNDSIYGDAGNDVLVGGAGDDRLFGGTINDTLSGGLGNDLLDGGSGNNTVDYNASATAVTVDLSLGTATGEGADTLVNIQNVTGSAFKDTIIGNAAANILQGGGGNDTIQGGDGNDTIRGGDGNDIITGGVGTDTAFGEGGNDTLNWDSADSFDGGTGFDTVDASQNSTDTIDLRGAGFKNVERILTGSGKDVVTVSLSEILTETADRQFIADMGGGNPDTLKIDIGGGWTATTANKTLGSTAVAAGISLSGNMKAYTFTNGTDTVTVFSNAETVQYITPLPPLFTALDDIIDFNSISAANYAAGTQYDALAGNDVVTLPIDAAAATHAGYDATQDFHGGDGNDTITAGNLGATIYGDSGMDVLKGGTGNDTLHGGTLADTLSGGLGNDVLDGGTGTDTADYHAAASAITANLELGTATGEGTDSLLNMENVTGSAFNDTITGNALANLLDGGDGDDTIHGGDGNDTITGGAGTDHLFGDGGNDTLKWDSADTFDGGAGFDTIDAVLISADTIDMRGPAFANIERIQTGSGKDVLTLSLNDVLSDTADHQFIADMGSSSPDTLNIDTVGGWTATTANATLGPTAVGAGISVAGMTAYTFTNGADTVTVFSNAEVVHSQVLSA